MLGQTVVVSVILLAVVPSLLSKVDQWTASRAEAARLRLENHKTKAL